MIKGVDQNIVIYQKSVFINLRPVPCGILEILNVLFQPALRGINGNYAVTVVKYISVIKYQAVGYRDLQKAGAFFKRPLSYSRNPVRDNEGKLKENVKKG